MWQTDARGAALAAALAVVLLGACGGSGGGREVGEDSYLATLEARSVETEADSSEPTRSERETLADVRSGRRAMEQVDRAFPHSEHRDVGCRRCHLRPEGHVTHRDAECGACHGRPAEFASLPDRTAAECAACHHADVTAEQCSGCHSVDRVGERPVLVSIQPSGADSARVRRLVFNHADHRARACTSCHTAGPTLRFDRGCGSCHEAHHAEGARCLTCHIEVDTPAHDARVHAGCAGSDCHEPSALPTLVPTRNLCLACHQELQDHKPGQTCTQCHRGAWQVPARSDTTPTP